MSGERNRRLDDFSAALSWLIDGGFEFVVIGGMAVGVYAPTVGQTALSADLDLLATPRQQRLIEQAAANLPDLRVLKRPAPRSASVLVLDWSGLEIDVLTHSDGLPAPDEARARAWDFDGVFVVDPVDLLANKLALRREKDRPHLPILRAVCEFAALRAFETASGRGAFDFVRRWATAERWDQLPAPLMADLLERAASTSPEGRRYLATECADRHEGQRLLAASPLVERSDLEALLNRRFGST